MQKANYALTIRNVLHITACAWGLLATHQAMAQSGEKPAPAPQGAVATVAPATLGAPPPFQAGTNAPGAIPPGANYPGSGAAPAPAFGLASAGVPPAGGVPVNVMRPDNAAQMIENAQRNAAVYRAQADEAKAREALDAVTRSAIASQPPPQVARSDVKEDPKPQAPAAAEAPKSEKPEKAARAKPPTLIAIFGRDSSLQASIRLANGVINDVRVGDELDDGYKVKSISAKKVVVEIDREPVTLVAWSGGVAAPIPGQQPLPGGPQGAPSAMGPTAGAPSQSSSGALINTNPALSAGGDPIRAPRR